MWTHKLLSVLVLISIGQANSFHQKQIPNGNDDDKTEGLYVLQDADDARRAFVVTRESTPNSMKLDAGFQLFEIPIGPQFSYSREKDVSEVDPMQKVEPPKSGWKLFPFSRAFTDNNIIENVDQDELVKVAAGKLKQQQNVGFLRAMNDESTFPRGLGARSGGAINFADQNRRADDDESNYPWGLGARSESTSDDEIQKNELATDKVSAGLQIFGLPLGPQFSYNSNREDDGSGYQNDALFSLLTPLITNMAKKWVADYVFG